MTVKTVLTANVVKKMNSDSIFNEFVINCIYRHLSGDWGEMPPKDIEANNADPLFAMSLYTAPDNTKIILKQDYNVLAVFFPEEY